jgi:transcriptional regulator with XRE-family HTH domain
VSFGHHLQALREKAGLSRSGLAQKVGVPVSTLRNWEAGRGFPPLAALVKLARVLGVPVGRFAEGVDDPAEDEEA